MKKNAWKCLPVAVWIMLMVCAGCDPAGTGRKVEIGPGEIPPGPAVTGGDYIQPDSFEVIEGLDMATFSLRWNEFAGDRDLEGLYIDKISILYEKHEMRFETEFTDWLSLGGKLDYSTGFIGCSAVNWNVSESMDPKLLAGAVRTLLFASHPGKITENEAEKLADRLGIFSGSGGEFSVYEEVFSVYSRTTSIDGLEYFFQSSEVFGGELVVCPE